jgi:uncharacterized protein (TIGR02265 family)
MGESRVVFKHCAEALLRSLQTRMTPQLRTKLVSLGLNPDGVDLPPAFDYDRWREILAVTGEELMPGKPKEAHHELGERLTDAYLENFIGRALKPVIKLIGIRRAMGRMRQNFRVANNYSEATATEVAPGHVELGVNETGMMGYFYRGILAQGLKICDPKNLSVEIASEDANGVVFSVRWDV